MNGNLSKIGFYNFMLSMPTATTQEMVCVTHDAIATHDNIALRRSIEIDELNIALLSNREIQNHAT